MTMSHAKSFLLFTTPFCPSCPAVKAYMSKLSMQGDFVDATQTEGSKKAMQYGVVSVPTVVFFDEKRNEVGRAHNVSSIRVMLSDS